MGLQFVIATLCRGTEIGRGGRDEEADDEAEETEDGAKDFDDENLDKAGREKEKEATGVSENWLFQNP
jgi:hypothetical protein